MREPLVAGALLYVWARLRGVAKPESIHWQSAAIIGGLLLLGGNGLLSWALRRVPSGISALIIGSTPLWMVLLEWLWHSGPRPTVGIVSGLVVGFVGLGFLVTPGRFGNQTHLDGYCVASLLLAAFLWAAGSVYSRHARLPSSQLAATAMEMLAGGALLLLAGGALGEWTTSGRARDRPLGGRLALSHLLRVADRFHGVRVAAQGDHDGTRFDVRVCQSRRCRMSRLGVGG